MISFEVLALINLMIAVLALSRLRPATFFIAANQLLTLRALISFRDFGPPSSEESNPAALFSPSNLETASHLFAVGTAVLLLLVLINPKRQLINPKKLPAVPPEFLIFIALFVVMVVVSSKTILSAARVDWSERTISPFGSQFQGGGLLAMLCSVILYELYRRVSLGQLRPIVAFLIIVVQFTVQDLLKGTTGLAVGYITFAAIILLGAAAGRLDLRRVIAIAATGLLVVLVVIAVRSVREDLSTQGWKAVERFSVSLLTRESSRSRTGEGVETSGNGTQYAAHVLEGISLYETGMSREWKSFTEPLILTFQPAFLVEPLGLERPVVAASELQDYFISGGGFFLLGEFYWNGGLPAVLFGWLLVAGWAFLCDTRYRSSALWLILLCSYAPMLLAGMGYGFATAARGAINGIWPLMGYWALAALTRRMPPSRMLTLRTRRRPATAAIQAIAGEGQTPGPILPA